ncbi:MAG: ral secretion pathway protein [Candidatus Saccharibacteria bacterium]|nr:ral secretion pathway protein [Candidatus Saccharibacteria bacterium]
MWAKNKQSGFTIVELLIVIVVIGILAAITVVAYNGIQSRANDTAVQSDLTNIAKKYELYKVDNDTYPFGGTLSLGAAFKINISKNAYDITKPYQLLNCTSSSSPGTDFAVLAVSKSGKKFYVSSNASGSVKEYTATDVWLSLSTCVNVLAGSAGNGAGYDSTNGWRAWTSL